MEPAAIITYPAPIRTEARLRGVSEAQARNIAKGHAAKLRAQGGVKGVNLYK